MSVMDMFRNIVSPQPAAPAPAAPGNPTAPAATVAATQQQETTKSSEIEPESPLANFADLWKNDDKGAAQGQEDQLFNIDPAKLQEAVAQTNFSQVITPEIKQKLAAGGEDAIAASLEAMNKVAQATYAHSTIATTKIVEQAMEKMASKHQKQMEDLLKRTQVSDNLRSENPLLSNPAVDPLLKALEFQFTQKYPNSSAQEITQKAKDYLSGFAAMFAAQGNQQQKPDEKPRSGEYDFSSFLPS